MPVCSPKVDSKKSPSQRKSRRKLWDGLTITLAVAVVLLGLAIFILPKHAPESKSAPTKAVSPSMASVTVPAARASRA
jgi:hypothetical protein